MIIKSCTSILNENYSDYCWSQIRRFQNVNYVSDLLMNIHKPDKRQKSNVLKQAEQIRYCLMQAKEYYDASKTVTLVTKPVLLYYSIMTLALAEILFKQDGKSNLQIKRSEHKHHGLILKTDSYDTGKLKNDLSSAAKNLRAEPMIKNDNKRSGTFELWHQSAREYPVIGDFTTHHDISNSVISKTIVLISEDRSFSSLPKKGINLFDCLINIPELSNFCNEYNIESKLLRGNVSRENSNFNNLKTIKIIIHPGNPDLASEFFKNIKISPSTTEYITLHESHEGGGIIRIQAPLDYQLNFLIPQGVTYSTNDTRFWPSNTSLNEFGYIYVAMFIAGTYARYYPDLWAKDVETATPLALAVENFIDIADRRVPLLILSELTQKYHFIKGR